jgi:hypothetical protein
MFVCIICSEPLTNEMWRIDFHLKGHEQEDDDDIDFEVDRVHITYQNRNY